MNKNVDYTFVGEDKRKLKLSHEMTSLIKILVQCANKRVNHVHPITFLKEKH
jgi:hypothetical protein